MRRDFEARICAGLLIGGVALAGPRIAGASTITYVYDPLGRLVSAAYGADATCQTYKYDAAGNRTQFASSVAGPPVANNDSYTTNANLATTFDPRVNDSSPSCYPLTITAVGAPSHGAAVIVNAGQAVTYTPATNYSGSDSFDYTISDTQSQTASATISLTVQLVALTATVDHTTWNWMQNDPRPPFEDPARVVTASGGQTPYAYAWQYVSGQTGMTATAPTSNATQWSYSVPKYQIQSSVWRCKVTDHAGTIVYAPNVTVTFTSDPE